MKKLVMMILMIVSGFLMVRYGMRIVEDGFHIIIANDICMMSKGILLNEVGKYSGIYLPFYRIGKELIMFIIGTGIGTLALPRRKEVY